jgi:hypothetical protein
MPVPVLLLASLLAFSPATRPLPPAFAAERAGGGVDSLTHYYATWDADAIERLYAGARTQRVDPADPVGRGRRHRA